MALRSQEAAKQYKLLSEDEKRITNQGSLIFFIFLTGDSSTFGKNYHAVLFYQDNCIQPFIKQNPKVATWRSGISKYSGSFTYRFPLIFNVNGEVVAIDPNGKVTLTAISPEGKETRFKFDLSKMR